MTTHTSRSAINPATAVPPSSTPPRVREATKRLAKRIARAHQAAHGGDAVATNAFLADLTTRLDAAPMAAASISSAPGATADPETAAPEAAERAADEAASKADVDRTVLAADTVLAQLDPVMPESGAGRAIPLPDLGDPVGSFEGAQDAIGALHVQNLGEMELTRISHVHRSFDASTVRLWYTYQYVGLVGGRVRCGTQRVKPICRLCA
ncbi:MAG: hypothetical protein HQ481_21175, partial [Alphaproteobacteria bacterium]|nr:hypothetical protein [Alphaproteobacteria bacterium]